MGYPAKKKKLLTDFGYILCRNCLLRYETERGIEGKLEVLERQGKRRKQLPDD